MTASKPIRIVCVILACITAAGILLAGGYVAYVFLQYARIPDRTSLTVVNNRTDVVRIGEEYEIVSYNLGFGAYSPAYSFFMDTGEMRDGTKVKGKYAKGMSRADVRKNVDGQLRYLRTADADFYFLQEADEKADRSYGIDMCAEIRGCMPEHASVYAENFHTAYLLYPFSDPIGKTEAGILTLSRYNTESAVRRSFPVTRSPVDKLFDLDRCFSVHYLPVSGSEKKLVLINLHMSAYDKGGTIRAEQLAFLNGILREERDAGNYVVAGGDFNHCLIADAFETDEQAFGYFASEQKVPDWVKSSVLREAEIASGYRIATGMNAPTCRGADIPYTEGVNFSTVIDGFLVSDNVRIVAAQTADTRFAYSDHNPVTMRFCLV